MYHRIALERSQTQLAYDVRWEIKMESMRIMLILVIALSLSSTFETMAKDKDKGATFEWNRESVTARGIKGSDSESKTKPANSSMSVAQPDPAQPKPTVPPKAK